MVELVTDDVLDAYIVTAGWNDLADELVSRYRALGPNVRITTYTAPSFFGDVETRERWGHVARAMRAAG
jgi:hypothetical protein